MKKIVIYGLGYYGIAIANYLYANSEKLDVEIIACTDKRDIILENHKLRFVKRDIINMLNFDLIIVTSNKWYQDIKDELINEFHIAASRIILFEDYIKNVFPDDNHYCNVCKKSQKIFFPFGINNPIFDEFHIIGGGARKTGACPDCGCIDRNRWVWFVIQNYTDILKKECDVLHIAPERNIGNFLRKSLKERYITGDIILNKADYKVDLTKMQFEDGTFDFIICNHVLEHIPEEKKAFSEMKRCLKHNGYIMISFPICKDRDTYEDSSIQTDEERLKAYGQADHCRIYGKDAKQYLEAFDLDVTEYTVNHILIQSEIDRLGLIDEDTVFICSKKEG